LLKKALRIRFRVRKPGIGSFLFEKLETEILPSRTFRPKKCTCEIVELVRKEINILRTFSVVMT